MFEKLIVYKNCIAEFKKQHNIVIGGFPCDSFHDFYKYYGDIGMLGFFLQYIQKYNFRIILNGKNIVVFHKNVKLYDKPSDIDIYDLVSRTWYGILIVLGALNKKL